MPKAIWEGATLAESNDCVVVEGNQYFPAEAVNQANLRASTYTSICPWKGTANYYDIVVGDKVNSNAAWYYANPFAAALEIKGRIAFWKGVKVEI
jgi:uncharacterized protein (DUF427 family)